MRYVEGRQRRRWPHAAITPRAQGGCGLIQRQNSSPMLRHRNRHPSLSEPRKTPARAPPYFFNSLPGPRYFRPSSQARSAADKLSRDLLRSKIFNTTQTTKTMGATLNRRKDVSPRVSENTAPMTERTMPNNKMVMRPAAKSVSSVPTMLPSDLRDPGSGSKGFSRVL